MPAAKKINTIRKLGIIAGGGALPALLIDSCLEKGVDVFVVGFKGQTDSDLLKNIPHQWAALGAVGQILENFKQNSIKDLVLIGQIRRPKISEIRPDWKAAKILSRIGFRALGDDGLLKALRKELEIEGFTLHGIHEFCEELLVPERYFGPVSADENQEFDIHLGIEAAQNIGRMDIGQAVVVQNGKILAVECTEGTNALIQRGGALKESGIRGPILVKTSKPQQDRDLDLPTIGPSTIELAYQHGFSGVVFEAGATLVVDAKKIEELAARYKMLVKAVSIPK